MNPEFRYRELPIIFSIFIFFLLVSCSHTGDAQRKTGPPPSTHTLLLDFYQGPLNHLSAVRHGQCPMHPSCSEYSRESLERFGPLKGWMMTFDRLMRCGRDEIRIAPRIFADGSWKYYDPVIPKALAQKR